MERDDDDTERIKRVTLRFPVELHRWYRHHAVDEDTTLELATLAALAEWAAAHGYTPTPDNPPPSTSHPSTTTPPRGIRSTGS